jgi:tricorn protease
VGDGYYRFPCIWGDTVVFVAEDDLWAVGAGGGRARRLSVLSGPPRRPRLTPDGRRVVFSVREDGGEDVYAIPLDGGPARRLTHLGGATEVAGFLPDGRLAIATDARGPFPRVPYLFALDPEGGEPQGLPYGRGTDIAFSSGGAVAVGRRNFREYAYWKRYRGGTAGQIWIDAEGAGAFRRLEGLEGDQESPMWIGDRLYFLSAHEGVGNLYSCRPDGSDVRRHTDHVRHYARNAASDGQRIVYHCGGDLYVFDPADGAARRLEVEWSGPAPARAPRFVPPAAHLTAYDLHPQGHSLALTIRGKPFLMGNWEGPTVQLGRAQGVHYRLATYLPDGGRVAVVSDEGGAEAVEVHAVDGGPVRRLAEGELGRVYELSLSPTGRTAAVTNQRMEVMLVDLESGRAQVADRSESGRVRDLAWSPDGRYLAYSFPDSRKTRAIRLFDTRTGSAATITRPVLEDFAPAFDPLGRYLYFLSARVYDPAYDSLMFAMSFPRGIRPYLVTLRRDLANPFLAPPRPLVEEEAGGKGGAGGDGGAKGEPPAVEVDLDGIEDRVLAFPLPEGLYRQIAAGGEKVFFTNFPVRGQLEGEGGAEGGRGELWVYDLKERTSEVVVHGLSDIRLGRDGRTLAYRSGDRLRVVRAGEKVDEPGRGQGGSESAEPGRKSGWIDLERVRVRVDPAAEWRQMLAEAWRNMRDHFWDPDMSGVAWEEMYDRYAALLPRVATREELYDLIWEMQGELGTSHAYVWPAAEPGRPRRARGYLGAEFAYDEAAGGYRVTRVVRGDTWDEEQDSPLRAPGVNVAEGDVLLAVNGRRLDRSLTPGEALENLGGQEVRLTFAAPGGERAVTVRTLRGESQARYREWVEANRAFVHRASGGRVGYVHVPNMMARGFSEFHRGFLAEAQRDALLVDVRFNAGGHVSQLLIERLRREIVGYDQPRWGPPEPYPEDAVRGPLVCLTNESAGSDGDIFSHAFKLYRLGPLIGTRTWGGVIGISGERALVDGTVTTQPEFSFWFRDAGWGVENHGVDPDIVVEDPPMDFGRGRDAQLERAVEETMRLLAERGAAAPAFGPRPRRDVPTSLPPR